MMFPNMYQPFNYNYKGKDHQMPSIAPKHLTIELAFSMFMNSLGNISAKERMDSDLLLHLLIDCLNQNYHMLKDERTEGKYIRRYTAEFNCQFIHRLFPYFAGKYLSEKKEEKDKHYSFFLNHSYLISSEGYRKLLSDLGDFLNLRKREEGRVD